jgi:hypothetical protein
VGECLPHDLSVWENPSMRTRHGQAPE